MTCRTENRTETVSAFRRVVTILALVAWTSTALTCPVPDDADDEADTISSQSAHNHADNPAPHHDSDECCQVLSHTHAIVQGLITPPSFEAMAPSFVPIAAAAPIPATTAGPVTRLIPVSNSPPRSRYLRFATFWSHAPPTDRA